jgi:conjugal transfer pilin signal peptidase TrbI
MRRRQVIFAALCLAIAVPLWVYVALHTRFSLTPSLNYRFFWISGSPAAIAEARTGDYVAFTEYVPAPVNREAILIKRIGCAPGEQLSVDNNDAFFCNGKNLGHARHSTMEGAELKPFRFNGPVPPGKLFLIGDHPASFDSRYFGFVDRSRVKKRVWPCSKVLGELWGKLLLSF